MDQGITLHIVISNLVNSINPTFSLGGYPHFSPHGLIRGYLLIVLFYISLIKRTFTAAYSVDMKANVVISYSLAVSSKCHQSKGFSLSELSSTNCHIVPE